MRVSTTPVSGTSSEKLCATLTASWPVSESTTSSTSAGLATAATAFISAISASSTWSRPAVSSSSTSTACSFADSSARRAMSTGCWPGTIGSVATATCSPSTASCSCAAGRLTSSDAISAFLPCFSLISLPSLAVVVVLPEPCRPTIMITAGGRTSRLSGAVPSPPSIATSSSLTILTTCWPGVTDLRTFWPTAFSVTAAMKSRATGSATSASSSATRTSRIASRTSCSFRLRARAGGRRPRPGDRTACRT